MRLFSTIFAAVLTFSPFSVKMAVFCISEKYSFDNRNFEKLKLPEYFYPPSQHFFVVKDFNRFFVFRRKVALCQSGRMAHTPRTVPINVPIDRITPGYRQVVFQFSIINLTTRIRKRNLSTPPQLTTGHKWHRTTSHCLSTFSQC